MIVRKDKGYEANQLFPSSNWYENEPDNYVVDERTPEGNTLAGKIKQYSPYMDLVIVDGQLVDVIPTERQPEPPPIADPDQRIAELEQNVADLNQLLIEKGISP